MKLIAVPIHAGRVSPVFDVARIALVISLDQRVEHTRHIVEFSTDALPERVRILKEAQVETLICAAISRPLVMLLESQGIEVIPKIRGEVDAIISAYASGALDQNQFLMPGCCGGSGRGRGACGGFGRGGGGRGGRGRGFGKNQPQG